eukprot:CAMPEP_0175130808 /NCGR_PEP_ID=MMETSP0087-20121206/6199_1 /TAXON_ID=136419 /ORGANISM="Unknown Unknown, Strain D1" /LENGTH=650 /DNA_ID=CAMNT_0016413041 /DNA_START=78 /DNA_END=2030 /DNA_ORIENTATION=-
MNDTFSQDMEQALYEQKFEPLPDDDSDDEKEGHLPSQLQPGPLEPNASQVHPDLAGLHIHETSKVEFSRDDVISVAPKPRVHRQQSLANHTLQMFALSNGHAPKKGFGVFKRQGDIQPDKLLSFSKKLPEPCTKNMAKTPEKVKLSLQIFKNITGYMLDRKSSKKPIGHFNKLASNGITKDEAVRDEIIFQICRQTCNNPNPASVVRGFKLLALCLGTFPPSKTLKPALSTHLQTQEQKQTGEILEWITMCRETMEKAFLYGCRKFPPIPTEIAAVENKKPVSITVELMTGKKIKLQVQSQTSALDISETLWGHVFEDLPRIDDKVQYGLYQEAYWKDKFLFSRILSDEARVMDVVISWMRAGEKTGPDMHYRLVYKAKYFLYGFLKENALSPTGLHHYYLQGREDVVHDNFIVPESVAVELAALSVQMDNYDPEKPSVQELVDSLWEHIPQSVIHPPEIEKRDSEDQSLQEQKELQDQTQIRSFKLATEVLKTRSSKFKGMPPAKMQRLYLNEIQKLPHYGAVVFKVKWVVDAKVGDWDFDRHTLKNLKKNTNLKKLPKDWRIGVGERGIIGMEASKSQVLKKHISLDIITSCGSTPTLFWYIRGDPRIAPNEKDSQRVVVMETGQGKTIEGMINTYRTLPHNKCKYLL